MLAYSYTFTDNRTRADVAAVTNSCRCSFFRRFPSGQCPFHCVMRVQLNTGGNTAVSTDEQSPLPVQDSKRADPCSFPYLDISEHEAAVINTRSSAES